MSTIQMGNDEFILYVRKHCPLCSRSTSDLGEAIWKWIRDNDPTAAKVSEDQPCRWGKTGPFVSPDDLPKTAAQFSFDRDLLPVLYDYLDEL